jgi:cupin 2 domain-containing protein
VNVTVKNVFSQTTASAAGEEFLTLLENSGVKIERIVSHSDASPEGFWYDQDGDEWVMMLTGSATLEFAGGEVIEMGAGDYLTIPRHLKHRVARTSQETIWLAVHLK